MSRSRPAIVTLALFVAAGPAWGGTTSVRLRILDAASGKITPAMISITDQDGQVRLPPDGRVMVQPSGVADFNRGFRLGKDRTQIGPVSDLKRRIIGKTRSGLVDSPASVPYWKEPVMFMVTGDITINLPEGRYRIAAGRGTEYVPVVKDFSVGAGGAATQTITLKRWINLPEQGWWSGDVHVHHPTAEQGQREFLLEYARAADLHVVNLLEMGHSWFMPNEFKQAGFGKKFRVRRGDYCLVPGQEDPRAHFGHLVGLNITRMIRDLKTYELYDITLKKLQAQKGAVVGFAHFAVYWELMNGFPWWVTTGDLDYVEMLQYGRINTLDYYDYLNLGFKLAAAGGSDAPYGVVIGDARTYVWTGPSLDIDAWFAGLKRGRTFVSNGPALEFTVDNQLPGSEISKSAGESVAIEAKAKSHPAIGVLKTLRLVGNEGIIQEVTNAGKKNELTLSLDRTIQRSQWVAAEAVCENGTLAHSSPVYIIVGGRPHWSAERGPAIIQKQINAIDQRKKAFLKLGTARAKKILLRMDRARAYYVALREKMKE